MSTEACEHTGRVRPVVWMVTPDGEVPQTVVCEQCWRSIDADDAAFSGYVEGEDGWYSPAPGAPRNKARD